MLNKSIWKRAQDRFLSRTIRVRPRRRNALRNFEALESRILLTFLIEGTSGDDFLSVNDTTPLDDGVTVNGKGGFDTLIVSTSTLHLNGVVFNGNVTIGPTLITVGMIDPNTDETSAVTINFSGIEAILITGSDGPDNINGSNATLPLTVFGLAGNDTITGGSGNDVLSGEGGEDTIRGGDGDDDIDGGEDRDRLFGEGGDDTVIDFGTLSNEILSGGPGNDSVQGFADTLDGGGDNDVVAAAAASSSILGGSGDDLIVVENPVANIDGGSGYDVLRVTDGKASVLTSPSTGDISFGSRVATSFDELHYFLADNHGNLKVDALAGIGIARFYGNDQRNVFEIIAPANVIGAGEYSVRGMGGNDDFIIRPPQTLLGSLEVTLEGGDGNDKFILHAAPSVVGPIEIDVRGENGTDTVEVHGTAAEDLIFLTQISDDPFNPNEDLAPGDYTPDMEAEADRLLQEEGIDIRKTRKVNLHVNQALIDVSMRDGDASYRDAVEEILIFGNEGNDTVRGFIGEFEGGNQLSKLKIEGGDDNDLIDVDGITTTAVPGTIKLFGNLGDDLLHGRNGPDELDGGDHNDLLIGMNGGDTLYGRGGQDVLVGDGFLLDYQGGFTWFDFNDVMRTLLSGMKVSDPVSVTPVGTGQDFLYGGDDDDFLIGGVGNDTIEAGPGNAIIFGDAFLTTPVINVDPTIQNGETVFWDNPAVALELNWLDPQLYGMGNDIIAGGDKSNLILGGEGDDDIEGSSYADGWDFLFGHDGLDTIEGLDGNNIIVGGSNPSVDDQDNPVQEFLNGGNDFDLIIGDEFTFGTVIDFNLTSLLSTNPLLTVELMAGFSLTGGGADRIFAEGGVNLVMGGANDDEITGGNGLLDALFGNSGRDRIDGLNGTNIIVGGQGADSGEESDVAWLRGGDDTDFILGDSLDFVSGLSFDLSNLIAGQLPVNITKKIVDSLSAQGGKDTIDTGNGINFAWGGVGNDEITGGTGPLDVLFGNEGDDTIHGSTDPESDQVNLIVGGAGSDPALNGGDGFDIILGDELLYSDNTNDFALENSDSITSLFQQSVTLFTTFSLNLFTGSGLQEVTENKADTINAGDGFNLVWGGRDNDTIKGGDGVDVLYGQAGNDTISGGKGFADLIMGGDDLDFLYGYDSNATLTAGDGANIIFGDNATLGISFDPGFLTGEEPTWPSLNVGVELSGDGDDQIYGADGFDFLVGGDGSDNLWGRDGFNIAFGDDFAQAKTLVNFVTSLVNPIQGLTNLGKAAYELAVNKVKTWIYDVFVGSEESPGDLRDNYYGGKDTDLVFGGGGLDYLYGYAGFDILVGGGDNDVVDVGTGPLDGTIGEVLKNFGFGGPGDDEIIGGPEADLLGSTLGNDIIHGGGGNDTLVGGEDDDQLYGEEGDDLLYGDSGNDILVGGPGFDRLFGGTGNNTFDEAPSLLGSDLVGRLNGNWSLARSNGINGFTNESWGFWVESAGWSHVMTADLDGDGNQDIIGQADNGEWWAARSDGTSFTTEYWGYWVDLGWQDVQVADVDNDGDSDVVGRSSDGTWWVAKSNGVNGFTNELWGGWVETAGWSNVMVADLNGDGKQDIIGQANNGEWWAARSDGTSFTTEYWGYWVDLGWQDVHVADVDNDGDSDVVGRSSDGTWWVAKSNGVNGFTNELWGGWVETAGWSNVMVADLNGDGKQDIIGQANNGEWWAARSTGSSFTTEYWGYWVDLGWQDVEVIDVNQDGNADVVGRTSDGYLWVARSNGTNVFTNELWGQFAGSGWQDLMAFNSGSTTVAGAFVPNALTEDEDQQFWQAIA